MSIIKCFVVVVLYFNITIQPSAFLTGNGYNDFPAIHLGVLSNKSELVKTLLIDGTCFQLSFEFGRCEYYSDCCPPDPSLPLEQLAANTFSCHDGYYIVDKCPPVTDNHRLRDLCEKQAERGSGERINLQMSSVVSSTVLSKIGDYCCIIENMC